MINDIKAEYIYYKLKGKNIDYIKSCLQIYDNDKILFSKHLWNFLWRDIEYLNRQWIVINKILDKDDRVLNLISWLDFSL